MYPKDGDVLVSNPGATVEHCVSVVPKSEAITCVNHDAAVATAHEMARERHVDCWLTEDHTHFLRLGSYRAAEGEGAEAARSKDV